MDISHDVGMLAVRLGIGMIFAAHGVQKLFGWFGGYGLKGTGGFFEGFGFRPGALFAALAGILPVISLSSYCQAPGPLGP